MELELLSGLNESKQYRSMSVFKSVSARQIADHAFMDMIAIWILYNEFEYAPQAINYATRTVMYSGFKNYRTNGTDLYLCLHIISEARIDLLATSADTTLLSRINLNTRDIITYLRQASNNTLTDGKVRQTLQRLEQSLHISNSNYRSIRRLAQSWATISTSQKRAVITRMLMYYRINARRSEMFELLTDLAKTNNLVDKDASNPEHNIAKTVAAGAVSFAAGAATGYQLGKRLV